MGSATVKQLRQKHPDHDPEWLEMIAALADGGKRWHRHVHTIIPKNAVEPSDVYADRKRRAGYTNHMGGILGLIVGHLFAKPVSMDEGGAYWGTLQVNADRHSTSWGKWWASALLDALKYRQSFAGVNVPRTDRQFANRADQEKSGSLDAFLVPISGEHVIDWGDDSAGNLEWLITETRDWSRKGVGDRVVIWRWTHYTDKAITTYEWTAPKDSPNSPPDGAVVISGEEVPHGYGVLPVARLRLPVGLWAGEKLRDPALGLTRRENDLDWSLFQAAHALLVIKAKWDTDEPVLGAGYYLRLGQDDQASYVEPSGSSFQNQAARVKASQEALYRVVQQLAAGADQTASTQTRSAESKSADWKASEIILSAYATEVLGAMRATADIVEAVMGSKGQAPQIGGLDGYKEESTESFLERAALAIDARQMSPLFRRVVAKQEAKRILGDEVDPKVLAEILDEIDASVVEEGGVFQPTLKGGAADDMD